MNCVTVILVYIHTFIKSATGIMNKPQMDTNLEPLRWNISHHQQYAFQYPYMNLDETHLRHILNFTIMNPNATSFKVSNDVHNGNNNIVNYECNAHENDDTGWFSTEFQATVYFMYISIFIIAILGNGMVCFIVCQSSRMQTVTNYFIANLALADMSMAFFCIPFSFISQFVLQ